MGMNVLKDLDVSAIEKRAYINGKYVAATTGRTMEKLLSFDGRTTLSGIAACGKEDVDDAVAAAKAAYDSGIWRDCTPAQKRSVLLKMAELMENRRMELALLDAYETGRAFRNYYEDSIPKAIEAVTYFAESIDKLYDVAIPPRGSEFGVVTRTPLGVVGLITPWNDPMVVSCWKLAPALLTGNSVVLKPAEQSSLSAIRLAGIAKEAGIPDGVFNVVPGYGEEAGEALALHMDVRGISFTGSSETGKRILTYAGKSNMKRVTLECGGKGPYIVTEGCGDLARAAKVLAENMFYNQGQICSAPSRVIIAESIHDAFVRHLKEETLRWLPGDTFDIASRVGCVVNREQYEKVQIYIKEAREAGYDVFCPEEENDHPADAFCIKPTVITDIPADARAAREEIFGPVVAVIKARDTREAVSLANASEYGLAGAVWTDDINEAFDVASRVEVGLMHVNSYGNDDNSAPFGGVKQSGLGKDKSLYAFDDFSDKKTVWMHFEKTGNGK